MASGCYASYNSLTLDYVQPTINQDPVLDTDGALTHYAKTISFRAFFSYATYAAWNTGRNAIDTALKVDGQTLTITDPSSNTLWSFGASDCIGDGPIVKYSYVDSHGYTFWVNVEVTGGIPPGGSGTTVTTYEDKYAYNKLDRVTYTRTGTMRSSTAYASSDAAMTASDPSPGSTWEYVSKEGTLDKDAKELKYTWVYIEAYETLPSEFASLEYTLSHTQDGKRKDVTLSASAGVDFDGANVDGLRDKLRDWGKGKLPDGARISALSTTLDKRNGSCTLDIAATAPVSGDIVASTQTSTIDRTEDFVIRRRLGGGGSWKQRTGDPITVERISGTAVGLTGYPPGLQGDWDRLSNTKGAPTSGPEGQLLYPISYSAERTIVSGGTGSNRIFVGAIPSTSFGISFTTNTGGGSGPVTVGGG